MVSGGLWRHSPLPNVQRSKINDTAHNLVFIFVQAVIGIMFSSENPFIGIFTWWEKTYFYLRQSSSWLQVPKPSIRINTWTCYPLNAKCCMWVWDFAEKCGIQSFFCQTIPSWLRVSGAKAYYSPTCNLNLFNCLQTRLFHVTQWGKLSALAPNVFLFYFSLSKTLPPLGMHRHYFTETLGKSIF